MSLRYLVTKLLRAIFTLWAVVTFVFIVLRMTGDPTDQLLPDDIAPEIADYYRALWGLDRPIWQQYLLYFQAAFQGDFGVSFRNGLPALDIIGQRVPKTLELGAATFATAHFGGPASRPLDRPFDHELCGLRLFHAKLLPRHSADPAFCAAMANAAQQRLWHLAAHGHAGVHALHSLCRCDCALYPVCHVGGALPRLYPHGGGRGRRPRREGLAPRPAECRRPHRHHCRL
jgi:peptide/nickel transport system permease protein